MITILLANHVFIIFYPIIVNTVCFDKGQVFFFYKAIARQLCFLIDDELGFWSNRKKESRDGGFLVLYLKVP